MSLPDHHPFPFDPTYGLNEAALRTVAGPEEADGFDAFWQARYARARAVAADPVVSKPVPSAGPWIVSDIRFTSTDDQTIGGWLLLPRDGKVKRGLIVGHGYGGRDAPDLDLPVRETAVLFTCFRGLSRSRTKPIPDEASGHVLYGIDDRDHYVIGGCVEDLWVSVSALTALFPGIGSRIGYSGISFGGGIGALALPYDDRIDRGFLEVPTFGNRPLWLSLPTIGSANAVQAYAATHPEVAETLRIFDAAIAARRLDKPMLVAAARFDPAVAPPCQFSVANALPKRRHHEIFILDAGHFEYPGEAAQKRVLREKVGRLFDT
ncbi:acetylxylan esterase [Rhizobium sp. YIM 134829]|uniref:acetylxylan esterase n=1 Tax=Rhizobium sp. YIM 134829 TaxID=3390453 RepID=UPI00397B9B91